MKFIYLIAILLVFSGCSKVNKGNEILGWFPKHTDITPDYGEEYLGIYTQIPVKAADNLEYLKYGVGYVETYGCVGVYSPIGECPDSSKWVNVMYRNKRVKSYYPHGLIKVHLGHAGYPEWMRKYRPWWFEDDKK